MPKKYTKEERAYLLELAMQHGKNGLTWTGVGALFVKRYPDRPITGAVEKARVIKHQMRNERHGYQYRDQEVLVSRSDLVRWRRLARQLSSEITGLIGRDDGIDDDG